MGPDGTMGPWGDMEPGPGPSRGQARAKPGPSQGQARAKPGPSQGQARAKPGPSQGQAAAKPSQAEPSQTKPSQILRCGLGAASILLWFLIDFEAELMCFCVVLWNSHH